MASPTLGFAAFTVNTPYYPADPYDNAQMPCAPDSLACSNPLSPEEEEERLCNLPLKEAKHFYGRAAINAGTLALTNIENRSLGIDATGAVVLNNGARLPSHIGLEIALGYFYDKNTRFELEYLVNRILTYSANPVLGLPSVPRSITAHVINNTFLLNGYYEFIFCGFDAFRPFATAGIGPSLNWVKSIIIPGAPATNPNSQRNKQYVSLALGGGVGFRYIFCNRWSLVASIRYISLGKVKIEPNTDFRLQGSYGYLPISLGLFYVF